MSFRPQPEPTPNMGVPTGPRAHEHPRGPCWMCQTPATGNARQIALRFTSTAILDFNLSQPDPLSSPP